MLTSISPVGEHGRGQRWAVTVGAYIVGSVLGGVTAGAALGALGGLALGWVPQAAKLGVLMIVAVTGLALEFRVANLSVPTWRRQVDERWLTSYRGWVYGLGFGFQLGAGFVTIVTSSTVYLAFAAALLTGSPLAGGLIGAVFGLCRSLPLAATWRVRSAAVLAAHHRRLDRWTSSVTRVTHVLHALTAALIGMGMVR